VAPGWDTYRAGISESRMVGVATGTEGIPLGLDLDEVRG
jgi:hypothetical protein